MIDLVNPEFRTIEAFSLAGAMAVYGSQAEASEGIPRQWRSFLMERAGLTGEAKFYGASPCTADGKIHYLAGVADEGADSLVGDERLTLEAGEYVVVRVDDTALLRDTWVWMLGTWLAGSGRREKKAPEFERYTGVREDGTPMGPVEIWIPLEPVVGG